MGLLYSHTLQGELKKYKTPTFNGEKYGEVVELWILKMKKYVHLHDYSDNQEGWIVIYNLQVKDYR